MGLSRIARLAGFGLWCCTSASAQTYQSLCEFFPQHHIIPGMAVLHYEQGHFRRYFCGHANLSSLEPFTPTTLFALGSISKVFTTTLYALEVINGTMQATDRVDQYMPALSGYPLGAVTVQQLATHSSGLEYDDTASLDSNDGDPYRRFSDDELLRFLQTTTLGPQRHHYSSVGVALLGYLISNHNHTDFGSLVYRNIVKPLQLDGHLYGQWSEDLRERMAKNYSNVLEEIPLWTSLNTLDASGSIRADSVGVERFIEIQLYPERAPTPLAEAIRLSQSLQLRVSSNLYLGLGWFFDTLEGHSYMNHNGSTAGFSTELYLDLTRKRALFFVGNGDSLMPGLCMVDHFIKGRCKLPVIRPVNDHLQNIFVGRYGYKEEDGWQGKFRISVHPRYNFLMVKFNDGLPGVRLYWNGANALKSDENFRFSFNAPHFGIFTETWDRKYSYAFTRD